jgi:hypothetical protein
MHSLKIARPLLASVAYFVLFAMALFSYVPRSEQLTVAHLCLPQDHRNTVVQRFITSVMLPGSNPRGARSATQPFLRRLHRPDHFIRRAVHHPGWTKWHREGLHLSTWPDLQGLYSASSHEWETILKGLHCVRKPAILSATSRALIPSTTLPCKCSSSRLPTR